MLINSNESIAKQVLGGFSKKATGLIWMSSAGLSTPALKAVLFVGYFFAVVFFAKHTDPEFMKLSIGYIDSVFRAYIVSFFQVVTGNINPFYISFAIYPFGIYAYWASLLGKSFSSKKNEQQLAVLLTSGKGGPGQINMTGASTLVIVIFAPFFAVGALASSGIIDINMWNQFKEIHHINGFLFF